MAGEDVVEDSEREVGAGEEEGADSVADLAAGAGEAGLAKASLRGGEILRERSVCRFSCRRVARHTERHLVDAVSQLAWELARRCLVEWERHCEFRAL